ncbi:MAG: hypothetical protein HY586_05875, partial [Candidatus Omnitrophica bacterium]|nr:hypothetical protein [Candidatus Omnitrophota bacterium]
VTYEAIAQISPKSQTFRTQDATQLPDMPWAGVTESPNIKYAGVISGWLEGQYDLRMALAGEKVGVIYNWEGIGIPKKEFQDLSSFSRLSFGLRTDASRIQLEIEDANGNKSVVYLIGAGGNVSRLYEVVKEDFSSSVDWAKIKSLSFFATRGDTSAGKEKGTLKVNFSGIQGSSAAKSDGLGYTFKSDWPGMAIQDAGSSRIISEEPGKFSLEFDGLKQAAKYGPTLDVRDVDFAKNPFLAVWAQGTVKNVKLEITDEAGVRSQISLSTIVSAYERLYVVDLSRVPGLRLDKISEIKIRAERNSALPAGAVASLALRYGFTRLTNTLPPIELISPLETSQKNYELIYRLEGVEKRESYELEVGMNAFQIKDKTSDGYEVTKKIEVKYEPAFTIIEKNPALTRYNATNFLNEPIVEIAQGSASGTQITSLSFRDATMKFDIRSSGQAFSALDMRFSGLGDPKTKSQDLSAFDSLIFGIKTTGGKARLEVEDETGKKDAVYLNYTDTTGREIQVFEIFKNQFSSDIDWAKVKKFSVIVDGTSGGAKYGYITLFTQGLYNHTRSAFTEHERQIKTLEGFIPGREPEILDDQKPGVITRIIGERKVEISYQNLRNKNISGSLLIFDRPDTTQDESYDFSRTPLLGFALSGTVRNFEIKVEDNQGKTAAIIFSGIEANQTGFYEADMSRLVGELDIAHIKQIWFKAQRNSRLPAGTPGVITMEYGVWAPDTVPPVVSIITNTTLTNQP